MLINKETNLNLVLTFQWYDMIFSLKKKEEYRDITSYYCAKLLLFDGKKRKPEFWEKTFPTKKIGKKYYLTIEGIGLLETGLRTGLITPKPYSSIIFSKAYAKNRPQMYTTLSNIEINEGKEEWGAEPNKRYFVLDLGVPVDLSNNTRVEYVKQ